MNADAVKVLCVQYDFSDLNLYAYCNNNPVNYIDFEGNYAISFATMCIVITFVVATYALYLNVKKAINRGVKLKSLLRTFPKLTFKKFLARSSNKKIPNNLLDKETGNVDLGKFKTKLKNNQGYRAKNGWTIEKDTGKHGGRKWKLKNKKGERIASLDKNGKVLAD